MNFLSLSWLNSPHQSFVPSHYLGLVFLLARGATSITSLLPLTYLCIAGFPYPGRKPPWRQSLFCFFPWLYSTSTTCMAILGAREVLVKLVMPSVWHMRHHRLMECMKIEVLLLRNKHRVETQILWFLFQGSGSQPEQLFYRSTHMSVPIFGVFSQCSKSLRFDRS